MIDLENEQTIKQTKILNEEKKYKQTTLTTNIACISVLSVLSFPLSMLWFNPAGKPHRCFFPTSSLPLLVGCRRELEENGKNSCVEIGQKRKVIIMIIMITTTTTTIIIINIQSKGCTIQLLTTH